jgi:hypothetical protein
MIGTVSVSVTRIYHFVIVECLGSSEFIGDCPLDLEDLKPNDLVDTWLILCSMPLTEADIVKQLGKRMAEEGYTPKWPIVIVPGFGSSSLEVKESPCKVSN